MELLELIGVALGGALLGRGLRQVVDYQCARVRDRRLATRVLEVPSAVPVTVEWDEKDLSPKVYRATPMITRSAALDAVRNAPQVTDAPPPVVPRPPPDPVLVEIVRDATREVLAARAADSSLQGKILDIVRNGDRPVAPSTLTFNPEPRLRRTAERLLELFERELAARQNAGHP